MAKPDKKKQLEVITPEEVGSIEDIMPELIEEVTSPEVALIPEPVQEPVVVTNTVQAAPATYVPIFPEDMTAAHKLEDPKPVVQKPVVYPTTGVEVRVLSSSVRAIVGRHGHVLEDRGEESVVAIDGTKYLLANTTLQKV